MHQDAAHDHAPVAAADQERSPIRFRAFPQFNDSQIQRYAGARVRLDQYADALFGTERILDRFAHALAKRRIVSIRELVESAEFFARVRRRLRASSMADLCCGHGLVGVLFAMCERSVEQVKLIDCQTPASFEPMLRAADTIGPWIRAKVERLEQRLADSAPAVADVESFVAVHACGVQTDRSLQLALRTHKPIAVMPCCYKRTSTNAPTALKDRFGTPVATDIDRTYRLEAASYRVRWESIPPNITAHHRMLIAEPAAKQRPVGQASDDL